MIERKNIEFLKEYLFDGDHLNQSNLNYVENILSMDNKDVNLEELYVFFKILFSYKENQDKIIPLIEEIFNWFSSDENFKETITFIFKSIQDNNIVPILDLILNKKIKSYNDVLLNNVIKTLRDNPEIDDLLDSFSNNQLASKTALVSAIDNLGILNKNYNVVIWGSWYGSVLIPKLSNKVKKIYNIDLDKTPLQISKNKIFNHYANVEYICSDIFDDCKKFYLDTNIIINTSCEHMAPMKEWKWFGPGAMEGDLDTTSFRTPKLNKDCYFAFQSNNMFGIEGHINCVNSLEEFKEQLPERAKVLYEEEVEDTRGTRYMLVGKFMPL